MDIYQRFTWPALLAAFLHFSALHSLAHLWPRGVASTPARPFRVETLSRELLRKTKLRTLGAKGGHRAFQMPLSSLAPSAPRTSEFSQRPATPVASQEASTNSLSAREQGALQREIFKNLAPELADIQALGNSDFHLRFEPPEGVAESELNSAEKMFYSFQRRSFVNYVHSFFKSYRALILERPMLRRPLYEDTHILSGQVVFDARGNILSIKILQSSSNDDVHHLFEKTLTQMGELPNPPKTLVGENGQFTIYYQMNINQR